MKKCPYCAEEIQDDAIKCRHCGEFLNKQPKGKWYNKNSSLLLLFVCVGPFMLPLVWTNPRLSKTNKVLITLTIVALTYFLTIMMAGSVKSIMEYSKQLSLTLGE